MELLFQALSAPPPLPLPPREMRKFYLINGEWQSHPRISEQSGGDDDDNDGKPAALLFFSLSLFTLKLLLLLFVYTRVHEMWCS